MSSEKIRALNDAFRTAPTGGKMLLTASINALPSDIKAMVIRRVMTFSEFNEEDNPHHEHDFGNFSLAGRKFFFKIDLYEDPEVKGADGRPAVTRVLTILLAEEW